MSGDNDTLRRALQLIDAGISVFPVPRPDAHHDGKRPLIAWREFQTQLASKDTIRRWFETPTNLAIVTGSISGIVVVDADDERSSWWCARHLPYTPWQTRTGRGGWHLYYQYSGAPVRNRARIETQDGQLALDVRGDGGYVIGPGSLHASGRLYEAAGDWMAPRSELPVFHLRWLAAPPRGRSTPPRRRYTASAPVLERARRYLQAIPAPEIGAGSDAATFRAAARLVRGFSLSAADAEQLLWEQFGAGRTGWDRGWIASKVRAAERYGQEPIGGLVA